MTQSDSQGEVASIDQFMEMSDGSSCSIFIDAASYPSLFVWPFSFREFPRMILGFPPPNPSVPPSNCTSSTALLSLATWWMWIGCIILLRARKSVSERNSTSCYL